MTTDDVPAVTRLVVVRHGETTWNAEQRMQGQLDTPLSEKGRWQAERVAEALAEEGIEAIHSSDLSRAVDTATPLAKRLGLPIERHVDLRERSFGVWQGSTYAEIDARWPEEALRWRRHDPSFGPQAGETLIEFHHRAVGAIQRIAAADNGRTIAVFTHGGVLDALHRAATRVGQNVARSWTLDNASVHRLLWTPSGFAIVGWDDARHLDPSALDDASVSSSTT